MSQCKSNKRRWLPFRLRLPIPGFSHRSSRPGSKSHFASAHVTITDGVLTGQITTPQSPPTASMTTSLAPTAGSSAVQGQTTHMINTATAANKVPTKPASDVIAGALARAASQSTIHPLDTMKVRLQAATRTSANPMAGVSKFGQLVPPAGAVAGGQGFMFDLRAMGSGVASLYKGVLGAASGAGIAIGAYFAFYGAASNIISRHTDLAPGAVAFCSGAVAAAGSSVVKVPLAVCIRSVQAGVYPNVFVAAKSITNAAGPRGLFTGYFPTLLEDVPDMAFKFAAYESLRQVHQRITGGRAASIQEDFVMGATAGALAAAATTPLDVIKTRMMCAAASRPTMIAAARAIAAQGGASAFFTGIGTRALSNGINSAVFFCFFESIRGGIYEKVAKATANHKARASAAAAHRLLESSDLDDDVDASDYEMIGRGRRNTVSLLARATPLQLNTDKVVITVKALKDNRLEDTSTGLLSDE